MYVREIWGLNGLWRFMLSYDLWLRVHWYVGTTFRVNQMPPSLKNAGQDPWKNWWKHNKI